MPYLVENRAAPDGWHCLKDLSRSFVRRIQIYPSGLVTLLQKPLEICHLVLVWQDDFVAVFVKRATARRHQ